MLNIQLVWINMKLVAFVLVFFQYCPQRCVLTWSWCLQTGAKIIIRGKGSVKEGKIGRKDGQPLPGEDEPLHAYITANDPANVKKAVARVRCIYHRCNINSF